MRISERNLLEILRRNFLNSCVYFLNGLIPVDPDIRVTKDDYKCTTSR